MTIFAGGQIYEEFSQIEQVIGDVVVITTKENRANALGFVGINAPDDSRADKSQSTRYEVHNFYDYFSIKIPNAYDSPEKPGHIEAYLCQDKLAVLAEQQPAINHFLKDFTELCPEEKSPARAMCILIACVLYGDTTYLETIENEIETMEELALKKQPVDQTKELICLRKKLLVLKRYYESLYDLLDDLEENQNEFFAERQLQMFVLQKNRVDRLLQTVAGLRDYVTQVREAYQNQLDISLNKTMQFFTVITTVFLPLTLIVGWYGMNLQMPELDYPLTYPIICVLSLAIVWGCLWAFKRKKWF